jgi:pimeloyl-ACP methyl ester carboxylesterase
MRQLSFEAHAAPLPGDDAVAYRALSSGPPVLFCCGLGTGAVGFHRQFAHLEGRYRCLSWEYRGLRTPARDAHAPSGVRSIAQHAADAIGIMDNERAPRVALVGWSLGVQVALEIFRMAPQRVALLVLVSGGAQAAWGSSPDAGLIRRSYPRIFSALGHAPKLATRALRAAARSPEAFTWARRIGLVGPGLDADLFAEAARSFSELEVDALLATLHAMEQHDASDVLGEIDVPTLVIGGDRDPFTSRSALERLVNGIRGAEYLLLPGAGHFALLDHAQHVNLRIDKLLSERGY